MGFAKITAGISDYTEIRLTNDLALHYGNAFLLAL
jgi:hypothetical protein